MVLIFYGNLKEILIKWSFAIWIWKQGRREDVTFGGGGGGVVISSDQLFLEFGPSVEMFPENVVD